MRAPEASRLIGYARVSTGGQSLDAQEADLKFAGCTKIFAEKPSGIVIGQKELMRVIDALGAGDVLVVTRLDRLARSPRDLLNTIHAITEKKRGLNRWPIRGLTPPHRTAN
jgi:DNA invertase Pin-like site-specific DNA recombinase